MDQFSRREGPLSWKRQLFEAANLDLDIEVITKGSIMSRVYKAAALVIANSGLTEEQVSEIVGSGKDGAIKAEDVTAYLEAAKPKTKTKKTKKQKVIKVDGRISQQDICRVGLMQGLSHKEIVEEGLKVYPDSKIKATHVSWTKGNERRKGTEWFAEYEKMLASRK